MPALPPPPAAFFSLARELRDQIYSELLIDTPDISIRNRIQLHATSIPRPHLLLINKQFSHEYLSISLKPSTLKLANHVHDQALSDLLSHRVLHPSQVIYADPDMTARSLSHQLDSQPPPKLPHAALRVQNLKFDLVCSRFRTPVDELSILEIWTDGILKQFELKTVKSVEVDVVVRENSDGMGIWELESEILWSENWIRLKGLKGLRVWRDGRCELGGGIRVGNSRAKRVLVLEWESKERRFRRCEGHVAGEGVGRMEGKRNLWLNTTE